MSSKINLNRVEMPKQSPEKRKSNFSEVALGYSTDQAADEAGRCLQCKKPKCMEGCPVGVLIPDFICALREGDMQGATIALKKKNSLPGICGRVCPQEVQCESKCILAKKGAPIAIGRLERYVADWELSQSKKPECEVAKATGKRVAVVGSGPAGLTVAADMAKFGHKVTIFEALHDGGGVLVYGIPEFRLPKSIVRAEIDYVKSLGVDLELDSVVGRQVQVEGLLKGDYDAIFLGIGAGAPRFLNVPGENLSGVYSANEYLTRVNLMKAYKFPEYDTPIKKGRKVAVVGGGNVAMDAARSAMRLGADEVHVIYRRSREEMPARLEEVENAMEEDVIFDFLTNPTRFLGDERGMVKAMEVVQMELGEPDASGRRSPRVKKGSEHIVDVDTVVIAVGTVPNPLIASSTPQLKTTKWGTLVVDSRGRTTMQGVWAGGDITSGGATVISAMGEGKIAAADMDGWLMKGGKWEAEEKAPSC
ncbi:MAG: Sulfide dehydrogenase subunit alpha precursor [Methanosaeta sp. PtaU1.Bin112]|nr:MAG: Sulfide dehydrogenase subunit alpha precursor [Methanosaeta sp. PtaU1.Bin112]